MMHKERYYIVTYDISQPKRWRQVFRTMKGYGEWLQLSVFQCRLTPRRRIEMTARLEDLIHHSEDQILIMDLGPADRVEPRIENLGKGYEIMTREAKII